MHKININNQEYILRIIVDDKGNVDHKAQLEVEEKWKGMTIEKPILTLITNKQYTKSSKD
jgi:hypothetical protein